MFILYRFIIMDCFLFIIYGFIFSGLLYLFIGGSFFMNFIWDFGCLYGLYLLFMGLLYFV